MRHISACAAPCPACTGAEALLASARVPAAARRKQSIEIIVALKKLGEVLTAEEKAFLAKYDDALAQFESADAAIDASGLVVQEAVAGGAAQ